ncbi:MAG: hypothetical protein ACJ8ER_10755 [Allosphingosinicella sp.]
MRAILPLALLLAGCGGGAPTAGDAKDAANAQLTREWPQIRDLENFDIRTSDLGSKWRVDYGGGTGGITIEVDKKSGKATIVEVQQ